jgi:pyrimidine operon attenuation protein/uracil phosphoribosyltransferase
MPNPKVILDAKAIKAALGRMARAMASAAKKEDFVLVGIQRTGVFLAQRLAKLLGEKSGRNVQVGTLDIAMHRDDLHDKLMPPVYPTSIPFDVTGKTVVLVDDVLFSGRTIRAALGALTDLGRPRKVQLAVLVDRGHRELPIQPDFVGKTVRTQPEDHVEMRLVEDGGADEVLLFKNRKKASS